MAREDTLLLYWLARLLGIPMKVNGRKLDNSVYLGGLFSFFAYKIGWTAGYFGLVFMAFWSWDASWRMLRHNN
jgi:hypothetical protein